MRRRTCLRRFGLLVVTLLWAGMAQAHHEAIFGPQSSTLLSKKRYVSMQYYSIQKGRSSDSESSSHVGVLSAGTSLGRHLSAAATLPVESERENRESATGVQDAVLALRYIPEMTGNQLLVGVFTVEPPTGTLEHKAVGWGGGALYGKEWAHWSAIAYTLGRTESSLEEGEKRGNRLFLGGGVAYERKGLPFSPQLGLSWERTGATREGGRALADSRSSAIMLHPTLMREFGKSLQAFIAVSAPVVQWSGHEGWQRFRVATGLVWEF